MELFEEVIATREVFAGNLLHVRVDRVRLPDGTESQREVVDHRGSVTIIAVDSGKVLMVRQYRLPALSALLEAPAGTLEPDEPPEACAVRELEEEAGFVAASWQPLFSAFLAPGYSTELTHVFLAQDLRATHAHADADERVELETVPLDGIQERILSGEIRDSKSIAALLMARAYLARP